MTVLTKSTKISFSKVTFSWDPTNTAQQKKYTDQPEPLPGGFISVPAMEITLPTNTGTFEKKECKIELPNDTFTDRLSNGRPHAPLQVLVQEVIQATDPAVANKQLSVFRGRVMKVRRNPSGRAGLAQIICQRPKSRLQVPVGLPVMHHCPFNTYGPGSDLDRQDFRRSPGITSIVGNIVTILSDPGDPDGEFNNGYMEFEGVTIKVREWDNDVVFTMIEEPPANWLNQFVNLFSGSNKTIEDVRDKLSNEINFGGIGFSIPPYNPSFEDAPDGNCG